MTRYIKLIAAAAALAVVLAGCGGDSSSSISEGELPPGVDPSLAGEPNSADSGSYAPATSSEAPNMVVGGSSVTALGNDWQEAEKLPAKALDWGPGGPVDSSNRSQSAVEYNSRYAQYNTLFIGDNEKTVYRTFDEGYVYGLTGSILETLRDKQVKAIFFVTHDFANRSGELVQRMIDEGHVVGNHSYAHKNYSTLAPKEMADDLMKMHDFVKEKFDYEMEYFRFPSGNFNEQSLAVVSKMGYRTLFWSFAYKDWIVDQQPDAVTSADKVVRAACPGNIYLLHAVSTTNDKILGEVIDRIRAEGYCWGDPATL